MKNRNIPYYVAALMLAMGVSTSFVSCVDTDEPETVTKLRAAAQEKLQADIELQQALETLETKTAENQRAQAALEKANAQYDDALAAAAELANKVTEAGIDNATKAKIQEEIAAYETARKNAEANKLAAEKEIAKYQAELEEAQKQIQERLTSVLDDMPDELRIAKNLYMGYFDAGSTSIDYKTDYQYKYDEYGNLIGAEKNGSHYETTTESGSGKFVKGTIQKLADATAYYNYLLTQPSTKNIEADLAAEVEYATAKVTAAEEAQKFSESLVENENVETLAEQYKNAKAEVETAETEITKQKAIIEENLDKLQAKFYELMRQYDALQNKTLKLVYPYTNCKAFNRVIFGGNQGTFDYGEYDQYRIIYGDSQITFAVKNDDGDYVTDIPMESLYYSDSPVEPFLEDYLSVCETTYGADNAELDLRKAKLDENYLALVKSVYGDTSVEDKTSDEYKGALKVYEEASKIYNSATAKQEDKEAAQEKMGQVSQTLFGTDEYIYQLPTDATVRRTYNINEEDNGDSRGNFTGDYLNLLAWKDYLAYLQDVVDAYTAGSKLYSNIYNDMMENMISYYNERLTLENDIALDEDEKVWVTAVQDAQVAKAVAEFKESTYKKICNTIGNMLDYGISAINADGQYTTVNDLSVVKQKVLADCAKAVAEAKGDVADAKIALEKFQAGIYDEDNSTQEGWLYRAKKDMEEAEANNEAAKAYYEEMLKVYSTSSK